MGVRGPVESLALPDIEVPGDFSSAAALLVAGALLGDPEVRLPGVNLNPRRTGPAGRDAPDGRGRARGARAVRRGRAGGDARREPLRRPARHRGRAGGGALDDRRAPARGAARRHGARDHDRARGGRAAGEGERPHRLGGRRPDARCACAPSARDDGFEVHRHGPPAGRRRRGHGRSPAGDAGRGGGPREHGGRAGAAASRPSASPTPASPATSPRWARCRRDRGHRRPRRRGQEHRGAGGGPPSGPGLPGHRGDVPRAHLARAPAGRGPRGRGRPWPPWRATCRWPSSPRGTATGCAWTART